MKNHTEKASPEALTEPASAEAQNQAGRTMRGFTEVELFPPPAPISDDELARLQADCDAATREWDHARGARPALIMLLINITTALSDLCHEARRAGDTMLEGAAGDALSLLYEIEKADPSQRRYLAAGDRYLDARRALRAALRAAAAAAPGKGCPA